MSSDDLHRQFDSSIGRDIRQTQQSTVLTTFLEHQLTEVSINRDQHTLIVMSQLQKFSVAGIRTKFDRFNDIVALLTQCDRQTMASTAVDQESHGRATSTSSSD